MQIDIAEWKKVKGYFEDKKIDSYLTAIPKFYAAFYEDHTPPNQKILENNIAGLKKEVDRAIREAQGDKGKLKAIDGLMKLIDNGERQIAADLATQAQALKFHVDLRTRVRQAFSGFEKTVAMQISLIDQSISALKEAMKAKDRNEVLAQREVLIGRVRDIAGIKAQMKETMLPVRNPTGTALKSLQKINSTTKAQVVMPMSAEIFKINTALLGALDKAEESGTKWAENAKKVAPALN